MNTTEAASTGEKKRILFVDDESNVLTGLKRMARPMRQEWDTCYADSGREALQLLAEEEFDVLVTDMRMPGMDGAMLLAEVSSHYPQVIRILLSGQCDLEAFIGSACPAHQLLGKPCDSETLKNTIERTIALRGLLENETLRGIIMQMNTLPSPCTVYQNIEKELGRADSSMQRIGGIISQDVGMTAKLLQLVNSPFFGFNRNIESPAQAAALLGINTVQFIMMHVQSFTVSDPALERVVEEISNHCMFVASLAQTIAQLEGESPASCSDAFIAGMMHDIGRLIMEVNIPDTCRLIVQETKCSAQAVWQIEQQHLGVTHAEIGAYLLGLWGLPECIVNIVAHHHSPGNCDRVDFFALTAVHIADFLVNNPELENAEHGVHLDKEYLDKLGLSDRMPDWQECRRKLVEKSK